MEYSYVKTATCDICGVDLVTDHEVFTDLECSICGSQFDSTLLCENGHAICDECTQSDATERIYKYCERSTETDPIKLVNEIFQNIKFSVHGPQHHFLIPAVLATVFYNLKNDKESKLDKLKIIKERSDKIPFGFCSYYGNCGAGVGTGIFVSIITDAQPLSVEEWKLSNLMTSHSLCKIAHNGGPRCCKRNTYLAIYEAVNFLEDELNISIPRQENVSCQFVELNNECIKEKCVFY